MIKTDNISYLNSEYDKNKRRKIVFMDRDGTIHIDKVETHLIDDLEFFPDTVLFMQKVTSLGYDIIVVTNQSGIGKGHYDIETMKEFNHMVIGMPTLWMISLPLIFFTSLEKQIYTLIERKMKREDYLVPSGAIDCPISYKKLLSIWLFSEFEATYIKAVKGELLFYSEDGKLIKRGDDMTIPENHENIKKFCNADNKEKKYLTSQMIDSRFYKISDIITDVPVEHIEK